MRLRTANHNRRKARERRDWHEWIAKLEGQNIIYSASALQGQMLPGATMISHGTEPVDRRDA